MTTPIELQISKLPQWAQKHIQELERRKDAAIEALREAIDKQTPAPFEFVLYPCIEGGGPTRMVHYVDNRTMGVRWGGVYLSVLLRNDNDRPCIELQYSTSDRFTSDVMLQPRSYQHLHLLSVPKE